MQILTFAKKTLSYFVVLLKTSSKQNVKVVQKFYFLTRFKKTSNEVTKLSRS